MKLNIMLTKIDKNNNIVKGTKRLIFSIPSIKIEYQAKNWRELHHKFFEVVYQNYKDVLFQKLVNNKIFFD